MMMGGRKTPEQKDGKIAPAESHGVKLISMRVFVPEDGRRLARPDGAHRNSATLPRCVMGRIGLLLIDLPPEPATPNSP